MPATETPAPAGPYVPGGGLIWFVDDEAAVLRVAVRMLERDGHRVSAFAHAEAALRGLQDTELPDVLVTDLHMPGVSGLDLARTVRATAPRLPIVICSGAVTPDLEQAVEPIGRTYLLYKPDLATRLRPLMRQLLDAART